MENFVITPEASAEFFTSELCHILELSNGPHDEALSIARARVAPGVVTRWHRLKDTSERYVILQGIGSVEIGESPAREVKPGDVVLIPPMCRQRIANRSGEDLVFLALCTPRFRPDCYQELASHS